MPIIFYHIEVIKSFSGMKVTGKRYVRIVMVGRLGMECDMVFLEQIWPEIL